MRTFDEVYAEEHPSAIRYAQKFFWGRKEDDIADQIVADVFFDLHRAMESGLKLQTTAAWLRSAIQIKLADYLRHSLRKKRGGQQVSVSLSPSAGLAIDDPGFEAIDNADLIRVALASLTETEREIADMVFMQRMHQTSVAEHLGVSRRTVERQVHQVRQHLRTLLSTS